MLCDDLISDRQLGEIYDGIPQIQDKIRRAQKFVLSPAFAHAADGLVDNIPELRRVAPYCLTPYPLAWVEVLHNDRPHWDPNGPHQARPVDPARHQLAPHRIGFLVEQGDSAARWTAHLFWSAKEPLDRTLTTLNNGSVGAVMFDTEKSKAALEAGKDALYSGIQPIQGEFGRQLLVDLAAVGGLNVAKRLLEYAVEDWGGETRFLVAVLGLLNSRNVAEYVPVDNEAHNAKRQRHGKRPLFSHTVVKVRPSIVVAPGGGGTGHRDVRMHFVRGHFKHRKSGLYWWSMHTRGKIERGLVSKDYEVEG